jgi:RND family efflux transporter MFP subunit
MRKTFIKFILPILIITLAALVAVAMVKKRTAPMRISPLSQGPMVETMTITLVDLPVTVRATGTVAASQQVEIIPQVSGVVEMIAVNLVQGAFFKKGELLLKIEETDYLLALEQARADLFKAELDLALIKGKAVIARRELASAKATVASASAKVKLAEVNLARTKIKAPFNCFIRKKIVDVGQYLRSGTMILDIAGTDGVEVVVPLPQADLAWLAVPRQNKEGKGAPATITMDVGGENFAWQGFLSRALGEVDAKTRMVDVVIIIEDPYLLKKEAGYGQELALGSFVQVEVQGRMLTKVARIPRKALHGEDQVWLVNDHKELVLRQVEVTRKEKDTVLIGNGLVEGERLVLTAVSGAANGLVVRQHNGESKP